MSESSPIHANSVRYFDPQQEFAVDWKRLPHWAQAGTICFITWRTADSLPKPALERLNRKRQELLSQQRLDPMGDWRSSLAMLPVNVRAELHWSLFVAWDEQLDHAAGACVLREPALSELVLKSLRHFDGDRYLLTDAIVMPNHVHLLVAFRDEDSLIAQSTSWKHYTATQINRWLRKQQSESDSHEGNLSRGATELRIPPLRGEFWQVEQFDHLVRSPDEFEKYRRYIAENPNRARLAPGEYRHFTRDMSGTESQSRSD